jgi:choline dehydrogenase-like flavoprotein
MGYLTLSPELQQRGATLNYSCNVLRTSWADYYLHADRAATTNDSTLREIGEAIRNVWRNLTDASKGALGLGDSDIFYKIVTTQEQAPNPDSRVLLAEARDAFGVPLASLHWQLTELDRHTIKVALGAIAQEFGASNLARIQIPHDFTVEPWPSYMVGSWHHCGTTRMHRDPKQGVVDADCKVHGMDNLYVAGSSVFPTGGNGNPTLTIIALALRLAEHVRRVLK